MKYPQFLIPERFAQLSARWAPLHFVPFVGTLESGCLIFGRRRRRQTLSAGVHFAPNV